MRLILTGLMENRFDCRKRKHRFNFNSFIYTNPIGKDMVG